MVTNFALRKRPGVAQRNHLDYAFDFPQLPSVDCTAASQARTVGAEVNATDRSLKTDEMWAVSHTAAVSGVGVCRAGGDRRR